MCRIGSIKSTAPQPPSLALRLMQTQQEGHDNSGFAFVMQDLEGVFSHCRGQARGWGPIAGAQGEPSYPESARRAKNNFAFPSQSSGPVFD